MFFTKEDILKIQKGLADAGIKDSQMEEAIYLKNNDTISIVQNGINKKINVLDFINQLDDLRQDNFINLSDRYDEYYISLSDAIKLIPEQKRNEGLVITFQGENGDWKMYQFKGDLTQFNHEEFWNDLYDIGYSGDFSEKPLSPKIGFAYFCTDRQTTEGATNGIMIYHKGNNMWVDALGRVVS